MDDWRDNKGRGGGVGKEEKEEMRRRKMRKEGGEELMEKWKRIAEGNVQCLCIYLPFLRSCPDFPKFE